MGIFLVVLAVEVVGKVGRGGRVGICGIVIGSRVVDSSTVSVVVLKVGLVSVHGVVELVVKIVNDGKVMVHLRVVVGLVINCGSSSANGDAKIITKVANVTTKIFISRRK